MVTLLGTPDLVRSASDQLASRARGLRSSGNHLRGAACDVGGGWGGPASLAFEAATTALGEAYLAAGSDLETVAGAGRAYADKLAAAQRELAGVALSERRLAEERLELQVRIEAAAATEVVPGQVAAARAAGAARLQETQTQMVHLRARGADIVTRHQEGRAAFVAALEGTQPPSRLSVGLGMATGDAANLTSLRSDAQEVAKDVRKLVAVFRATAAGADMRRIREALKVGDLSYLTRTDRKALKAFEHFRGPAWSGGAPLAEALQARRLSGGEFAVGKKLVGAVGGRVNLGVTLYEGLTDLRNGDPEHPGWRDVTTRLAGGVGAGGAGLLLAGGPATWTIGAVAVTAYGAYKVGTLVYDNREAIKTAATAAWGRAGAVASAGASAGKGAVRGAAQAVQQGVADVTQSVGDGIDSARNAVSSVGEHIGSLVRPPRWGW